MNTDRLNYWQREFSTTHETSYPGRPTRGMSREIYERDQKEIDAAAKQYGYAERGSTRGSVWFQHEYEEHVT